MATKKQRSVEARLIGSMKGLVDTLKRREPLTFRNVAFRLEASAYTPKKIAATRKLLGTSQAIFARFLGISTATVQSWERGGNEPSEMARRFMDEIRRNPDYWRGRLRESIKEKAGA